MFGTLKKPKLCTLSWENSSGSLSERRKGVACSVVSGLASFCRSRRDGWTAIRIILPRSADLSKKAKVEETLYLNVHVVVLELSCRNGWEEALCPGSPSVRDAGQEA